MKFADYQKLPIFTRNHINVLSWPAEDTTQDAVIDLSADNKHRAGLKEKTGIYLVISENIITFALALSNKQGCLPSAVCSLSAIHSRTER